MADLTQLVEKLSKAFDQCLDNALSDPTVNKEDKGSSDIACLKSTFLDLEHQLKGILLECMQNRTLSTTESITLLKRDINVKQATIEKYMGQLDNWTKLLPELEQKSISILNAPSIDTSTTMESDTNSALDTADQTMRNVNSDNVDDDDDDDDVEFEEV